MQALEPRLALAADAKIISVGVPAAGTYKAGDELRFAVGFNKPVAVTGTPRLDVTIGAAARPASYVQGDGTKSLQFRYVVQPGESDGDGIAVAKRIALPVGAAIRDKASGKAVTTTIAPPGTAKVLVDGVRPTIRSIAGPAAGNHAAGVPLAFTVSLSEKVTVTGSPTMPIEIGGQVRSAVFFGPRKDTAALSFRTVVAAGDFAGNGVRVAGPISLSAGCAIRDAAGNELNPAIAATLRPFSTVLVDGVGPSVTAFGVPTVSAWKSMTLPVTFSEPVTVVGKPTVPFTLGGAARQLTYAGGSGGRVLTFTYGAAKGEALTAAAMKLPQAARVIVPGKASLADAAGNRPVSLARPGDLSLTAVSLPENSAVGTLVGTLSTIDADAGDRFTYALVGGAGATDNTRFRIAGNRVEAAEVFDFESRAGYSIRVRGTDAGGLSIEKAFAIAVTDVDEAPPVPLEDIVLAPFAVTNRVAAGVPVGTPVGRLLASSYDNDGLTFALVPGAGDADNGSFRVEHHGVIGAMLVTNGPLAFAADTTCSIRLRVTGRSGSTLEKAIPIRVGPNTAPVGISLDGTRVVTGMPVGTRIGRLATTVATGSGDGGVDVFTYRLVPGAGDKDNARFAVRREPGDLRSASCLVTNELFAVGADTTYSIRLRVTSAAGAAFEEVFGITVERNVAPTRILIWDYEELGTVGGSLDGGSINVGSGSSNVVTGSVSGGQASGSLLLARATPSPAAAAPAGQPVGTFAGWLRAEDANAGDTFSFALVAGDGATDNGRFRIEQRDGGFVLVTNALFPVAVDTTCSIRLRVTDSAGNACEQARPITVRKNVAPTFIGLSGSCVVAGRPAGTVIGVIGSIGEYVQGDSRTYALVPGAGDADNGRFWVVRSRDHVLGRTVSRLVTNEVFAVAADTTCSVRLRVTDSVGNTFEQAVPITIQKNVVPTGIRLGGGTVLEGSPAGTMVASLSGSVGNTAVDAFDFVVDSYSFALVAGGGDVDNARFAVERRGLPQSWVLVTNQAFTVAADTIFWIRLRVTDASGGTCEQVFSITVVDNVAPTDIALPSDRVVEGQPVGAQVGWLRVSDGNGYADRVAWALVSGAGDADNAKFRVQSGWLVTNHAFTVATDTVCSVRVRATDSAGNAFEKVLRITVQNNVAPTDISLWEARVLEGLPAGTFAGSLDSSDPNGPGDTRSYALVFGEGDADNAKFRIADGTRLVTNQPFAVAAATMCSIRLRVTDIAGNTFEKHFTVSIHTNLPPTELILWGNRVREGRPVGTFVGGLGCVDGNDYFTKTYALVPGEGGADNDKFRVREDWLETNQAFAVDADTTFSIRLRVTDAAGNAFEKVFPVTVENKVAPTDMGLWGARVLEGQPVGTLAGWLYASDATGAYDTLTFALVAGEGDADNAKFRIGAGNELVTNQALAVPADTTYSIRARVTDSVGNTLEKVLAITVENNVAPMEMGLSGTRVLDGQPAGTAVGMLTVFDANGLADSHAFALVSGEGDADNAKFRIVEGVHLVTRQVLAVAADTTYSIRVRVTDSVGNAIEQVFAIEVDDNAAPTDIALSATRLREGCSPGTVVGSLTSLDATDAIGHYDMRTYALVSGAGAADNGRFRVENGYLVTNDMFTVAADTNCSIRLRVTDSGGNSFEKVFTIAVENNLAPTDLSLSGFRVLEGLPAGAGVGRINSFDPTGYDDTPTYSLVPGDGDADNGRFQVQFGSLMTNEAFTVAEDTTFSIRLRVADTAGNTLEKVFAILVRNNAPPTDISLSESRVFEGRPVGTFVGWLSSRDPTDSTGYYDPRTCELVSGEGDTDNGRFAVVVSSYYQTSYRLVTHEVLSVAADTTYSIRLRVTDSAGNKLENVFGITVANDPAPTDISLSGARVLEGQSAGAFVGWITSFDPSEYGDTPTYSLVPGEGDADNHRFRVESGNLVTNEVFTVTTDTAYSIRLRVADSMGNTFEKSFAIVVVNNTAPSDIILTGMRVLEGLRQGALVGWIDVVDPTDDTAFFFDRKRVELAAGEGDTDNSRFAVVTGDSSAYYQPRYSLLTRERFAVAADTTYSIRLRATDSGGNTFEKVFAITVVNNVPPADITLSETSVREARPIGTVVGWLGCTDANDATGTFDQHTYELVSGEGDADNARFAVRLQQAPFHPYRPEYALVTNEVFSVVADTTYSIRLRVTDSAGDAFEKVFAILVAHKPPPIDMTLTASRVLEGQPWHTYVGALRASSLDPTGYDGYTYMLVSGEGDADNGKFAVTGWPHDPYSYQVVTNQVLSVSADTSHSIRVRVTDSAGNTFEKVFAIMVENNVAPTDIVLSESRVLEGRPADTVVGLLGSIDATDATGVLDQRSYELVAGEGDADNARFALRPPQLYGYPYRAEYSLVTNEVFAVAADTTYSIRLRVSDSVGNTFEKVVAIIVVNNVAPTEITLSGARVLEGQPAGTFIGWLDSLDPTDATGFLDKRTYELVHGEGNSDNGRFVLNPPPPYYWSGFGVGYSLVTNEVIAVAADTTYSIRVRVTDSAGNTFEKVFAILVEKAAAAG